MTLTAATKTWSTPSGCLLEGLTQSPNDTLKQRGVKCLYCSAKTFAHEFPTLNCKQEQCFPKYFPISRPSLPTTRRENSAGFKRKKNVP